MMTALATTINWSLDDASLTKQLLAFRKPKLIKLYYKLCKSQRKSSSPSASKMDIVALILKSKKHKHLSANTKSMSFLSTSIESLSPITPNTPVPADFDIQDEKKNESSSHAHTKHLSIKIDRVSHKKRGSYIWILDKDRKITSIPSPVPIDMSKKRVSLTNMHNFLWISCVLRDTVSDAHKESEITKPALHRILSLLPIHYRAQIWDVINEDDDTFIVAEDYKLFVDALLIASAQKYQIDTADECEMEMELRNMLPVVGQLINVDLVFKQHRYITSAVSKSKVALSTEGAKHIVLRLRNLQESNLDHMSQIQNDLALPILTGLTKSAFLHSLTFATRYYWRVLTKVYWDEDDPKDIPLCTPIAHFNQSNNQQTISNLFGDLYCEMDCDLKEIDEDVQLEDDATYQEQDLDAALHNFLSVE